MQMASFLLFIFSFPSTLFASSKWELYDKLDLIDAEIFNLTSIATRLQALKRHNIIDKDQIKTKNKEIGEKINKAEINKKQTLHQLHVLNSPFNSCDNEMMQSLESIFTWHDQYQKDQQIITDDEMPKIFADTSFHSAAQFPTSCPTKLPTSQPTNIPTLSPTKNPTALPTESPTIDLSPMKKSIHQRRSARTKGKAMSEMSVSAKLEEELLLNQAILKNKKSATKSDIIKLYDFDFEAHGDSSDDQRIDQIKKFEQELMENPDISLILTCDLNKTSVNRISYQYRSDILLIQLSMALSRFDGFEMKTSDPTIKYSAFLASIFASLRADRRLLETVNQEVEKEFPNIRDVLVKVLGNVKVGGSSDIHLFRIRMLFAQVTYEEVISLSMVRLINILDYSKYGKHNKIPPGYIEAFSDFLLKKRDAMYKAIETFCDVDRKDILIGRYLIDDLRHSIQQLSTFIAHLNIAAVIYEWRLKGFHGEIAVLTGIFAHYHGLDELLATIGYNASSIQRFIVRQAAKKPVQKAQYKQQRKKGKKREKCGVNNEIEIIPFTLNATTSNKVKKKDAINIWAFSCKWDDERLQSRVKKELDNKENDIVIVGLRHPVFDAYTSTPGRWWVISEIDAMFETVVASIDLILESTNCKKFGERDEKILRSVVNRFVFELTCVDEKMFEAVIKSLNCTQKTHYKFVENVRAEFKKIKMLKTMQIRRGVSLDSGVINNDTLDIIFDFFGCVLQAVVIKKEVELQRILQKSPYGQSGKIPDDLCPNKLEIRELCNYLPSMMRMIRNGATKSEFDEKYDFVIDNMVHVNRYKIALGVGDIVYDWKQANNCGAVSVICRAAAVDDIIKVLGNVTDIDVDYTDGLYPH